MQGVKSHIKSLSEVEKDRLIEINFYLFIKHLLETYNNSILSTDVIEALAQLYNCNVTLLKRIAHEIYNGTSIIIPSKQELTIMLYRSGMSIRGMRRAIGVHPQTIYRHLDDYINEGQFEYVYKLDEEELVVIKSFMIQLEELIRWR